MRQEKIYLDESMAVNEIQGISKDRATELATEIRRGSDKFAIFYGYKFLKEPEVWVEPIECTEEDYKDLKEIIVDKYMGKGKRKTGNVREADFIFYALYR